MKLESFDDVLASVKKNPTINRWLLTMALLFGGVGCSATPPQAIGGQTLDPECPSGFVMQPGSIGASRSSDEWLRREYSLLLDQIDARPLWCGERDPEAYRLIALPTRGPAIVVTAVSTPAGWRIAFSEYLDQPGNQPGSPVRFRFQRQAERVVDNAAVASLLDALEKSGLWTEKKFYAAEGTDGTAWSIEGRRGGRYAVISQARDRDDAFSTAALQLVQLSGSEWK